MTESDSARPALAGGAAMSAEAIALYHEKNAHLEKFYEAVEPMDFYRAIFPVGSFERAGHHEDAKPNGILLDLSGEKPQHRIVTDELDGFRDAFGREFVVMSPLAYSGARMPGRGIRGWRQNRPRTPKPVCV